MLTAILVLSILLAMAIAFIVAMSVFGRRDRAALLVADRLRDDLRRSFEELRSATEQKFVSNAEIAARMLKGVDDVRHSAEALGLKAEGLSQALVGGGKTQGIWGEAVLTRILDSAGLKRGVNYLLQTGSQEAGIPDSLVIDPAGRVLIIDSKTSLTAYIGACNAKDGAEADRLLDEHVKSVRRHVDELAKKDYVERHRRENPDRTYIPQVAMFVPSESAHAAAMARDPSLFQYAAEKGVAIVSPLTLQPYARLVSLAWQQDSVERNHERIVEKAKTLLERVDKCLVSLEDLGASLAEAQGKYADVMARMTRGPGAQNIVKPAEDLLKLGGRLCKCKAKALQAPSGE